MNKFCLILCLAALIGMLGAQEITGTWNGMLDAGGQKIRIVFHIAGSADSLSATMDSPDQGAFDLPAKSAQFENGTLTITADFPPMTYVGQYAEGAVTGVFKQSGYEFPLDLVREELAAPVYVRPQEPKEPYPYYVEEVTFENPEAGITLAGTLTLPNREGTYPVAVLVSGSGAQNRDEELMGHKPFLIIADYLARNGIGALRYDDRGFGASTGDFSAGTTQDFASDAASAAAWLQSRPEVQSIGLIGHSEGGIIAPIVAAGSEDIDFIVLLAGTGIRGDELLLMQTELIMRASGSSEEEIAENKALSRGIYDLMLAATDRDSLKKDIAAFVEQSLAEGSSTLPEGLNKEDFITQTSAGLTGNWMMYFVGYDPSLILPEVRCPVLALNGDKDLQVPADVNLNAIWNGLNKGGNRQVTTIKYPGLNHLFQECETGSPDEYSQIEQTFSPLVLADIARWIRQTAGSR